MPEVAGNQVRSSHRAEDVVIDCAPASGILFRKVLLRYTHSNASRITLDMPSHQLEITQSRRHQDVGPASTSYEVTRDVLPVSGKMPCLGYPEHVLSRSRFMLTIESVDVGTAFEQVLGDLDGRCQVQRRLTIPASGADHSGIRRHELLELVKHPEPGCCVRIQNGATFNQKCGNIR